MEKSEYKIEDVNKNLLDMFWKLGENNDTRIETSISILHLLHKKQTEISEKVSKDLEYTIERLVKGLASSRESANFAYTLLLTEVLREFEAIPVVMLLDFINKHLVMNKHQERRYLIFGQLYAYTALIRSRKLLTDAHLASVTISLYKLLQGHSYIMNAGYEIFKEIYSQLSEDAFKEKLWPHLIKEIACEWEKSSANTFWLLLLSLRVFPNIVNSKYLRKQWNNEDLFAAENIDHLKRMIKESTSVLPMLHPFCSEFIFAFLMKKDKELWRNVIDENLFEVDQQEKVFLGFELIKEILKSEPKKKLVKMVFTDKFCTILSRNYLDKKRPLSAAANQLAQFLCDFVKKQTDAEVQLIILKVFLHSSKEIPLSNILKKQEVIVIIQNLLPDAVKGFADILIALVFKKKDQNSWQDGQESSINKYGQAIIQVGSLVSHPTMSTDIEWRMKIIRFLFLHSFFVLNEPIPDLMHCENVYDPLASPLQDMCINSFYRAVDSLYCLKSIPINSFVQLLLELSMYADQLLAATENVTPLFPLEEMQESWQKTKVIIEKLRENSKNKAKFTQSGAFQMLFLQLAFLLFMEPKQVVKNLEELDICCQKALKISKHSEEESSDQVNKLPWVGVIVDILLSLLSKSSHHIRHLVSTVFPPLCPAVTKDALQQILDVINPEHISEETMLVDESEEEEENVDFQSGSSSSDEDKDEKKDEPSDEDEEFKDKVRDALGHAADVSDAESEVLTDSEMFKFDEALAEAFKSRRKNKSIEEDKTLIHFRIRCLDLIRVYLNSEPSMHMVIQCVRPVLAAYEYAHKGKQKSSLFLKAVSTIQLISRIKKFQNTDNIQIEELENLLDLLIEKCHKEQNVTVARNLHSLCLFIVLCYRKLKSHTSLKKPPVYVTKYITALKFNVQENSSHILPQFFEALMNACPDVAWYFLNECKNFAFDEDVRISKRTLCIGLMIEAMKYSKSLQSVTQDMWFEFSKNVINLAFESLKDALSMPNIKPLFITEMWNLMFILHSLMKEKFKKPLLDGYSELLPLLMEITSGQLKEFSKKGQSLRKKIVLLLGGTLPPNNIKNDETDEKSAEAMEEVNNSTELTIEKKIENAQNHKKRKQKPNVAKNFKKKSLKKKKEDNL